MPNSSPTDVMQADDSVLTSVASPLSPLEAYRTALEAGHIIEDMAQWRAVEILDKCHRALKGSSLKADGGAIAGVYLWGSVGRGKTWLMDRFVLSCPVPVRRWHFHHFMRWVHQRQFHWRGRSDSLAALADELVAEVKVLCLDEFYVEDIANATLLGGLLIRLFERDLVVIATSNQPPAELYRNGYNRDRLLPAIAAMEQHMVLVHLDGGVDHRKHPGIACQRYFVQREGQSSVMADQLAALDPDAHRDVNLTLGNRTIAARSMGRKVLWCDYAALCEAPLAALDFITLCDRFDVLMLGQVPALAGCAQPAHIARGTEDACEQVQTGDRELPPLSPKDDGVRRFIALVDECYDRGVPLVIEAEVPMDELYPDGHLAFAFRRTLSRLSEMQLERFGRG